MPDYEQSEPKKKSPWGKILIGCGIVAVLGILAIGAGVWWLSNRMTMDPQKVATMAAEIAPGATVPEGYHGIVGADLMGVKMVMIAPLGATPGNQPQGGSMFIVMASAPSGAATTMEAQMKDQLAKQSGQSGGKTETLDGEVITVGGEAVSFRKTLVTAEGDTDARTLQYTGTMPTQGGRVTMLMFMGPEAAFDRTAMDAFLGSILPAGK